MGDSHTLVLGDLRVPGVWFRAYGIGGATASGILNPRSKTESFTAFTARLARAPRWQQILLLLGEVDCGFLIWHRAERLKLSVDEQLAFTLNSYTAFIARVVAEGFSRVLVLSAPLPTISDSPSTWGDIANLRAEVTASKAERTNLTQRFNADLRKRCDTIGAVFVDVTSGHLDPLTGLVDTRFLRDNPRNHHLARDPYNKLVSRELCRLWSSQGARDKPSLDARDEARAKMRSKP